MEVFDRSVTVVKGYRGLSAEREEQDSLGWESLVCESVADVIEFWGFKRNHGRVWALLYLRNTPMSAQSLQKELGLSKGAVSMITTDLEQWSVIRRIRQSGKQAWHYVAEDDYSLMIQKVLREREGSVIKRVEEQLSVAEVAAKTQDDVPEVTLKRIQRMRHFAKTAGGAIQFLLQALQFDDDDDGDE